MRTKVAEYIYRVYENYDTGPALHRALILSEGAKRIVTAATGLAFHCRVWHRPENVHRTPKAAWDAYITAQREGICDTEEHVQHMKKQLSMVTPERLIAAAIEEKR